MNEPQPMTRREFLKKSLFAGAGVGLAALGFKIATEQKPGEPISYLGEFGEVADGPRRTSELKEKFNIEAPDSEIKVFSLDAVDEPSTTKDSLPAYPSKKVVLMTWEGFSTGITMNLES